jgi:hypothetical protein
VFILRGAPRWAFVADAGAKDAAGIGERLNNRALTIR